jgi:tripartite ATP-independent transporter DctP family solute receptor
MKKCISILIIMLLSFSLLTACGTQKEAAQQAEKSAGQQKVIEFKIAGLLPVEHPLTQGLYEFKKQLEAIVPGRVEVKVFPNMEMGGSRECMEAIQMGTLQMLESSLAPLAGFNKGFMAFNLPYLFKTREIAYEFLDGAIAGEMKDSVISSNFKILEYWENGFRHTTNSKRPIKTPADMKGLKIRTMENPVHMEAYRQMGANPVPMAFGEVFTALQQKTIDGEENSYANIYSMKFHEVQKYISNNKVFYDVTGFMINPKFYDSLPSDIQDAVKKAARKATELQRRMITEADNKLEKFMKENMEFTDLTSSDIDKFKEATKGTYDVFKKEIGEEKLQKIVDELAKIEAKQKK